MTFGTAAMTLLLAAQTAAAPAPAAQTTNAAVTPGAGLSNPAATKTAASAKPKLICEEDNEIGSRIAKKKVCMTKEEWREYRAENRQQLQRVQPMSSGGGG